MESHEYRSREAQPDLIWLNKARFAGVQELTVTERGTLEVLGKELHPTNPQRAPAPGSAVKVWYAAGNFRAATMEAWAQASAVHRERERAEHASRETAHRRLREEATAFNSALPVPVRWVPGLKDALHGAPASLAGVGTARRPVVHVLLQQDLDAGRLHRRSGDLLCDPSHSRWTAARMGTPEALTVDAEGHKYHAKVTCKTCLEMVARLARKGDDLTEAHTLATAAGGLRP